MSADPGNDVARAGRWISRKVLVALLLSSGIPLLVLVVGVLPSVGTRISPTLLVLPIVCALAGAWVIWDLGRVLPRIGALMGSEKKHLGGSNKPGRSRLRWRPNIQTHTS
jgi:hypothetical protein